MKLAKFNSAFQYEIMVHLRWWIVPYDAYNGFTGTKRARIAR